MVVFKRSDYEKGLRFTSVEEFKDYLYKDFKEAWNGLAPFDKNEIVLEKTDDENKKSVGVLRFHSTQYADPLSVGFCIIQNDDIESIAKSTLYKAEGISRSIFYKKK